MKTITRPRVALGAAAIVLLLAAWLSGFWPGDKPYLALDYLGRTETPALADSRPHIFKYPMKTGLLDRRPKDGVNPFDPFDHFKKRPKKEKGITESVIEDPGVLADLTPPVTEASSAYQPASEESYPQPEKYAFFFLDRYRRGWAFGIAGGGHHDEPVPEPATLTLLAVGLGGAALLRRRKD